MVRWFTGLLIILPMAVSLAGCGEDETWHGDTAFSPEERAAILAGAEWTSSHAHQPMPHIVWDGADGDRRIYRKVPPVELCQGRCTGTASAHRMWLTPGRVNAVVAAHEFGHVFGMLHVEHGLLRATEVDALEWSTEDADECARNCH